MQLVLLIFAFVLFCIGASSRLWAGPAPWPYTFHIVSMGLAFWVASIIAPMVFK